MINAIQLNTQDKLPRAKLYNSSNNNVTATYTVNQGLKPLLT